MKVVIGLGATGISCIEYLRAHGVEVVAMDSALCPSGYSVLQSDYPDVNCVLGKLDPNILNQATEIIVSPGVPIKQPLLAECIARKQPVIGDIELFLRATEKPIYAITGSNGKTTVTALVGEMARGANRNIMVAGNIGKPVLALLSGSTADGYVLELSSFQLETTYSLRAKAAVVLNVTPDHMDRYTDFEAYLKAKQSIYQNAVYPIVNLDSPEIWQSLDLKGEKISFSLKDDTADYCVKHHNGKNYLSCRGKRLLDVVEMQLQGEHNWQNALVALALGETMNLPMISMLTALTQFKGLAHRCQLVRIKNSVTWYNDSKGTNVGATLTAINSLANATKGNLILLAGGLAKDADFKPLRQSVNKNVSDVILFGKDAELIARALQKSAKLHFVDDLDAAVLLADKLVCPDDCVLLSPACASFDMFLNYAARGDHFIKAVTNL